jgi:hypothetical protein
LYGKGKIAEKERNPENPSMSRAISDLRFVILERGAYYSEETMTSLSQMKYLISVLSQFSITPVTYGWIEL